MKEIRNLQRTDLSKRVEDTEMEGEAYERDIYI